MVTINTTDDLLRLLDENPEFREAVRSAILTQELIALPAAFGAFASEMRSFQSDTLSFQSEMREFQSEMRDFQSEMRSFQSEMRDFQSEVRTELKTHTNDIGELKGFALESKLYNRGTSYLATELNVYDIAIIRVAERDENSAEFNTQLRDALENGAITMEEYNRVLRTDMIVSGRRPAVPGTVYAAIEASFAVHRADIRKVKETKDILDKIFPDAETYTALFYTNIQPFIENEAYESGIHLIEVDPLE